jgi:hypothetical protein
MGPRVATAPSLPHRTVGTKDTVSFRTLVRVFSKGTPRAKNAPSGRANRLVVWRVFVSHRPFLFVGVVG